MNPSAYLASRRTEGFEIQLHVDRSVDIEADRKARNLGFGGRLFFSHAILAYLLDRNVEADELASKAEQSLRLACLLQEKPPDYERGYDEGMRAAALVYVHWLLTDSIDHSMLHAAADSLRAYCTSRKVSNASDAEFIAPVLLYSGSYELIRDIADQRSWKPTSRRGLFNVALQIALCADEDERLIRIGKLRKSMSRTIPQWIERGLFDDVAYAMYALFPRPEGPPYRLIQECWKYLPSDR